MDNLINPAYHVVKLSEVQFQNQNGLWYLHMPAGIYHVGREFKNSLLSILQVRNALVKSIPLDSLVNVISEHDDRPVKIYVNDGCALAVAAMKHNVSPLDTTMTAILYEMLGKSYDVVDFVQDEFVTEFTVFNKNSFQLFPTRHGEYRAGGLVHIKHHNGNSVKIVAVLEHCRSGNYAIINNKALSLLVPVRNDHKRTANEVRDALLLVARADKPEFYNLIEERLLASRNTIASIRECAEVGAKLAEINVQRADMIKLPKVLDHYGMAAPDEKTEKWLASKPSHADRLQLFHLMVDTNVYKPRAFREEAGDFLFDVGDLEGTESKRLWSKKIRVQRVRVKSVPDDDNSDILSDFGSVESDSTSYIDDDDIVSDFGDVD
jgi:hypothetical protein